MGQSNSLSAGYPLRINRRAENIMFQAVHLKLERVAHEFADWQAVPEAERSPAPPWWWGVAIETMNETDQISPELCQLLDIPAGASYAHASTKLINALSSQTSLPPSDRA
jgi:hypothetical protein